MTDAPMVGQVASELVADQKAAVQYALTRAKQSHGTRRAELLFSDLQYSYLARRALEISTES